MPNTNLAELYSQMQAEMLVNLSNETVATAHSVTKGDVSETDWMKWIRNYLPQKYKIDKGIVIDSKEKQRDQIDVITYGSQCSYFVFRHENTILVSAKVYMQYLR